ncbi:MAG: hypothetical protein JNM65_10130 [Verrucomicrobiaceae bacterium]|nr:hypothetical protein [Verrucomicrobiaceae bacterium]
MTAAHAPTAMPPLPSPRVLLLHLCVLVAAVLLRREAHAHPADQSEVRMRPAPHNLEARFTFNLLTLSKFVRMDADADGKLSMAELDAARPLITEYLHTHILLEINQQKASWGTQVKFDFLWPEAAATPPMTEPEYAARNVDVTFTVPVTGRLLEDFRVEFSIFVQTGPMQTIRGLYEQDESVMEVPFTAQQPEYTYDTGFAEDPFVQEAEKKMVTAPGPVKWPAWLLIPACVALICLSRSTIARRLRTLR